MPSTSGGVPRALFRIFFVLLSCAFFCTQEAFAQAGAKPGPMQSGAHTPRAADPPAHGAPSQPQTQSMDVATLFATSCGWCHSSGGREAGKGPKLMGSALTDKELLSRIRNGKTGQMPAFKSAFTEQQMRDIVAYIRALKPAAEKTAK